MVPAVVMSVAGVTVFVMGSADSALTAAGWVWPVVFGALAGWMGVRIRRTLPGRTAWLLYPVIALTGLAAIGGLATTIQTRATAGQYPMPGAAYDVNGHSMHLNCTGTASPTVVLENGLGLSSPVWGRITTAVGCHHPDLRLRPRRSGLER